LNYTYAGEAALIAAIRPWMVFYRVYMAVVEIDDVRETDLPRERGGNMRHASQTSRVRFTHAPSGTFTEVVARGEAADVSDKAAYKAGTGAYKYALRQTFCIETGNDPDSQSPVVPSQAGMDAVAKAAEERLAAEVAEATAMLTGEAPPPAPPAPKLAQVHISEKARTEFDRWVAELIKKYPAYSVPKQGQPTTLADMNHIRASAAFLGHPVIDDTTYQAALKAIADHAAEKAKAGDGEKAPAKAASKAPAKGGAAKRPTNDDALKKAGF
jgi:hypothetical protein